MRLFDNCIFMFTRQFSSSRVYLLKFTSILTLKICLLFFYFNEAYALQYSNTKIDQKSFHFVWRNESPAFLYEMIQMLDKNNFDKLYIGITKSVCLEVSYWDCGVSMWSADELIQVIEYAKSYGLIVAVEIKMLNKTKKSFGHLKTMHINDETLDPEAAEFTDLYNKTFEYVAKVLGVSEIVIGFDEIYGFSSKEKLALEKANQIMLPSSLFIQASNTAYVLGLVNNLSVTIWGDMLIDNDSLSCPGSKHNHGSSSTGYNSNLLPYIPKNIKILAWYYNNTSSFCGIDLLRGYGFSVAVAVFKPNETRENLLNYASENNVNETVFTSFRYIRHKDIETADDLCKLLELGDCGE